MLLRFIIYAFTLYLIILFVMVNAVKIFRMNLKKKDHTRILFDEYCLALISKVRRYAFSYPYFQADALSRPIIIHLSFLIFAEYSVFRIHISVRNGIFFFFVPWLGGRAPLWAAAMEKIEVTLAQHSMCKLRRRTLSKFMSVTFEV